MEVLLAWIWGLLFWETRIFQCHLLQVLALKCQKGSFYLDWLVVRTCPFWKGECLALVYRHSTRSRCALRSALLVVILAATSNLFSCIWNSPIGSRCQSNCQSSCTYWWLQSRPFRQPCLLTTNCSSFCISNPCKDFCGRRFGMVRADTQVFGKFCQQLFWSFTTVIRCKLIWFSALRFLPYFYRNLLVWIFYWPSGVIHLQWSYLRWRRWFV